MNETQTIFSTANSVLNQMPFPMMIVNHEGIVAAWNRQAEKTFGYSADEVLGKFTPFIEAEKSGLHKEGWTKLLRSPEPFHFDKMAFIAKNKEAIFSSALAKAFTIENERYVFFHFEMTDEIQKDPSPYQELISLKSGLESSFMMLTMDQEGLINFANNNFLKRSKWTPKRIIGKTFWQMFPQTDDGTADANNIWTSLKNGKAWKGEVEKMSKDGLSYWVDLTAIPIFVTCKNPSYFILLENDITEKNCYKTA